MMVVHLAWVGMNLLVVDHFNIQQYFQADPITHLENTFSHSLCLRHASRIISAVFRMTKFTKGSK